MFTDKTIDTTQTLIMLMPNDLFREDWKKKKCFSLIFYRFFYISLLFKYWVRFPLFRNKSLEWHFSLFLTHTHIHAHTYTHSLNISLILVSFGARGNNFVIFQSQKLTENNSYLIHIQIERIWFDSNWFFWHFNKGNFCLQLLW